MSPQAAAAAARMLWFGFEATALARLRDLATGQRAPECRIAAFTELARWHGAHGRPADAIADIDRAIAVCGDAEPPDETRAIAIDLMGAAGRCERAQVLLDELDVERREQPDNVLRAFNACALGVEQWGDPPEAALELLNSLFVRDGLTPISLRECSAGLKLDNLRGAASPRSVSSEHLVSVVMPVWDAAATIGYALGGLVDQTWAELEVIVVDDGCSDPSIDIAESFDDERIRIVRSPGKGTYAARNFGVSMAGGPFITVHDADDWSHPEKVERQMRPLIESDSCIATQSAMARTRATLHFVEPSLMPRERKVAPNYSSLLVHRHAFDVLGPWDTTRVGADGEFIARCRKFYGEGSIELVLPDVPLSFTLRAESSLTGAASASTGILSQHHCAGLRRIHRILYERWHRHRDFAESLPLGSPDSDALFVRPVVIDPQRSPDRHLDVVMLGDFSLDGTEVERVVEELQIQTAAGMRTGLIHVPDYDRELSRHDDMGYRWRPFRPIHDLILVAIDGDRVQLLTAGEAVTSDVMLVRSAPVLRTPVAGLPKVDAVATAIVVTEPTQLSEHGRPNIPLRRYDAGLTRIGYGSATWYPASSAVRTMLLDQPATETEGITLADDDWEAVDGSDPGEAHLRRLDRIRRTAQEHDEATT